MPNTQPHVHPETVVAKTTQPVDLLNEWVVEVDGVRRARFVGPHATYFAARWANKFRQSQGETPNSPNNDLHVGS